MNSKDLARKIASAAAAIGFLPLATLCNLGVPAAAADFGQPFPGLAPPLADDRVEFATNWYVRGDLAYAQETYPNISPDFTSGSSPSVLNTYSAGVGMGYKVNNYFRTDLILDYRSQIHTVGINATPCDVVLPSVITGLPTLTPEICNGHFDTEIHRWDLLANGYLDLGTWDGFTPYLGASAGATWARTNQSVKFTYGNNLPCNAICGFPTPPAGTFIFTNFDRSQSNMRYRFAWAVMAGVSIAMTDHALLDVGYRYLDLRTVTGLSNVTGTSVAQRVRANELRAGVRYMID